jgi:lipoyl(octanoyl) transferase
LARGLDLFGNSFSIFRFQFSASFKTIGRMQVFEKLRLWMDPIRRPGPEAMAVDEWLLETADTPVLRVYPWEGAWGSLGYFGKIAEARACFREIPWVRRWTGGGLVDHRADWTYTVVAPQREALARARGAESYRSIHLALVGALRANGISTRLSAGNDETGAMLCFENPVSFDLLDQAGKKLAGAGQRRSKQGLLHQGSVSLTLEAPEKSRCLAESLATQLAVDWQEIALDPNPEDLARRVAARYAREEWTTRR